jgi:protein TonB
MSSELLPSSDLLQPEELLHAGLPPANDRMLTTCFLAALFHGIVILGVTFSAPRSGGSPDAPALEVVLVNNQVPSAKSNPNAHYIAQRTQLGTGNLTKDGRTAIPKASQRALDRPGVPGGEGISAQQALQEFGDEPVVAAQAPSLKVLYFAAPTASKEASKAAPAEEKKPAVEMASTDEGIELHLRGEARDSLWIAADTRESDVAVYLDAWRRKIERVGTLNFPNVARRKGLSGTPVIEVTIGADGKLLQTSVRRSSGHEEIDEAAMRILKLAAPYDAFPRELSARHDQIRIAYEWQFLGGAPQGTSVFYADPNAPGATP